MFKLIAKLIYTVLLVIETIVAIRFVLKMIDASTSNSFVNWIMVNSEMFVAPFRGIISESMTIGGLELELTSIVALTCYMIVAFVMVELIKTFSHQ